MHDAIISSKGKKVRSLIEIKLIMKGGELVTLRCAIVIYRSKKRKEKHEEWFTC